MATLVVGQSGREVGQDTVGVVGAAEVTAAPDTVTNARIPQETRTREFVGYALLWGCVTAFAPPQPTLAAAEYTQGTHSAVIDQSQRYSWIRGPFPQVVVVPDSPAIRPVGAGPQLFEQTQPLVFHQQFVPPSVVLRPIGFSAQQIPEYQAVAVFGQAHASVAAPVVVLRPIKWAAPEIPEYRAAQVWHPRPEDGPFITWNIDGSREEIENSRGRIWGGEFSGAVPVDPPNRPFDARPQASPEQLPSKVWGQTPPNTEPVFLTWNLDGSREEFENPRGRIWGGKAVGGVAPQAPPNRPEITASQEWPLQSPSWIKTSPVWSVIVSVEDPPSVAEYTFGTHARSVIDGQWHGAIWTKAANTTSVEPEDPPNRQLGARPQASPEQPPSIIWGQTPTSIAPASPLLRPFEFVGQQAFDYRHSRVWAPQIEQAPFLAIQLNGERDEYANPQPQWFSVPPVSIAPAAPPNRPFEAGPQLADLTIQARVFHHPPVSIAPAEPPNRPFVAKWQESTEQRPAIVFGQTPPSVEPQTPIVRQWQTVQELPLQAPSVIWSVDIVAQLQRPIIGQFQIPQEYPLQAPSEIHRVAIAATLQRPVIRSIFGAPQTDPAQLPAWVFKQQPEPFVPLPGDVRQYFTATREQNVFVAETENSVFTVRIEQNIFGPKNG